MSWTFGGWPPPPPSGASIVTFAAVAAALALADAPVSYNGERITNVGAPVDPGDAANAGFVVAQAAAAVTFARVQTALNAATGTVGFNNQALNNVASVDGLELHASAALVQIALGTGAGNFGVATGVENIAMGHGVLAALTTGTANVAIGTTIAADPLAAPGALLTSGIGNVLLGAGAGAAMTTGGVNTAVGRRALSKGATIFGATALGNAAMQNATVSGTAVGSSALLQLTTGPNNIAIGSGTLQNLTTGARNICMGDQAALGVVTGADNVAIGYTTMRNATGSRNVAIGTTALFGISGNDNVAVGYAAGAVLGVESGNILIGVSTALPAAGVDSQLNIGNLLFGDLAGVKFRFGGSGAIATQVPVGRIVNAGADTAPVLELSTTGANGASPRVFGGTRVPTGLVSGNAGDLYIRKSGAASGIYVNQSAADPGTTWVLLL
jgi:hypothetical protein